MHSQPYHNKVQWSGMYWIDQVVALERHATATPSERVTHPKPLKTVGVDQQVGTSRVEPFSKMLCTRVWEWSRILRRMLPKFEVGRRICGGLPSPHRTQISTAKTEWTCVKHPSLLRVGFKMDFCRTRALFVAGGWWQENHQPRGHKRIRITIL